MIEKGNKRIINGWAMYDWANSVYSLVIATAIFPIFYQEITETRNSFGELVTDKVELLGFSFVNSALYSYTLSFSFLLIALITPLLSGIADYSDKKKQFMKFFCYLGAVSCMAMYFFSPDYLLFGMLSVVFASIGFSGSLVFYNAYLPEIAEPEHQDRVSAKGYALGYVGSVILLILNLVMLEKPELFGISSTGTAARISFVTVGLWWAGFAQITFSRLPKRAFSFEHHGRNIAKGYQELLTVFRELQDNLRLKRFLSAFFVYNMAVQTVMYMAVIFAKNEIVDMPNSGLILSILIIQLIAIGGAYFFSFLSAIIGNIRTLITVLVIWVLICILAYYTYQPIEFYLLAGLVGFVMGGVQSLSRSTYSKLLPATVDHASYFSFYDVCEKVGIVFGTFIFGVIVEFTLSSRPTTIVLGVFFIIGLLLLRMVPEVKVKNA